jgi:hypothetical protein
MSKKKWFNLKWLTSEERKALKKLIKQRKKGNIEAILKELQVADTVEVVEKPYRNLMFSGDVVTVVLKDGTALTQVGVSVDILKEIKAAGSAEEIKDILFPSPEDSEDDFELIQNNLDIFDDQEDFIIVENDVFLKGVNLAIPPVVLSSFIEILERKSYWEDQYLDSNHDFDNDDEDSLKGTEEEYNRLKMFWMKLATCPIESSRESVYKFLKDNDVRITKTGNIIAYRRVVALPEEISELEKFVLVNYERVTEWQLDPSDFYVILKEDGEYTLQRVYSDNIIDTLDKLHTLAKTPKEQWYTSWHNQGTYKFRIGDIYAIGECEIDLDTSVCHGGGLHSASVSYDYTGYGDTPVVVLVNPAKVITVPSSDTGKFRTVEMKIALLNPNEHGVHIDEKLLEASDAEYNDVTIEQLEEVLRNANLATIKIKEHVTPLDLSDIENIKNALKDRVQTII